MEKKCEVEFVGDYYHVQVSQNFGRYLVASQDIPERTTILQEFPVVWAPADECYDEEKDEEKPIEDREPMIFCLSCSVHIKQFNNHDVPGGSCTECGWPLCEICIQRCGPNPHRDNECEIFKGGKVTFPPPHDWPVLFKSILVLRIILLTQLKKPNLWNIFFEELEHHSDIRRQKERCVKSDQMIKENIRYFLQGEKVKDVVVDDHFVERIVGIVNVNAFGASKGKDDHSNLRKSKSLFQEASLFAHSCAPNCTWNVFHDAINQFKPQIKVITSVPVKKDDVLTIAYNTRHLFYGTLKRQILIESIAHFVCKCKRCEDATELGTFMSSLRCFKCERGFLISKNPSDQESRWICTSPNCDGSEDVTKVVYFTTDVEEYIDKIAEANLEMRKEVEKLHRLFLKHYGKLLHKNHYVLQEISERILELMVERLEDMMLSYVELFLWHCNYLQRIADIIIPGYNGYQDQLHDYREEALYHKNLNGAKKNN